MIAASCRGVGELHHADASGHHPQLLGLVLVVPVGVIASAYTVTVPRLRPHVPQRETDLPNVYSQLPTKYELPKLADWCGLRVVRASLDESSRLREVVESVPDQYRLWCSPHFAERQSNPSRRWPIPERIRWYRLDHPTDRGSWIGIGVCDFHNTGWTAEWIVCRVPIGFTPNS